MNLLKIYNDKNKRCFVIFPPRSMHWNNEAFIFLPTNNLLHVGTMPLRSSSLLSCILLQRLWVPLRRTTRRRGGGLGGSSDFRSSARFTRDTRSRYARTTARSNWVTVSKGTAFSCPWENAACWHRLLHTPRSVFIDERLSFIFRLFHAPRCNDAIVVHSRRTHKRRLSDQVLANFSYRKSNDDWFPRPFSLSSTRKFTCRSRRLPRWVR